MDFADISRSFRTPWPPVPAVKPLCRKSADYLACALLLFSISYGELIRWLGSDYTQSFRDFEALRAIPESVLYESPNPGQPIPELFSPFGYNLKVCPYGWLSHVLFPTWSVVPNTTITFPCAMHLLTLRQSAEDHHRSQYSLGQYNSRCIARSDSKTRKRFSRGESKNHVFGHLYLALGEYLDFAHHLSPDSTTFQITLISRYALHMFFASFL